MSIQTLEKMKKEVETLWAKIHEAPYSDRAKKLREDYSRALEEYRRSMIWYQEVVTRTLIS